MADSDFQGFIDEVLARNDIVDIISGYTTLKRSGSSMMGLCPLHNDKKSPSLSVSPDKQIFHCFGCGAGGNAINFIQAAMNLDFMDALKYLADRANMEMPERRSPSDRQKQLKLSEKRKRLYALNADAARYFYERLASGDNPGIRYLKERKIKNSTIKKFGIGYAPEGWKNLINYLKEIGYTENEMFEAGVVKRRDDGSYYDAFFDGRVIFPIIDVRGNVIAFGGRIIRDGTDAPKYWNSPETLVFKKKDNLFGLNIAKESKAGRLMLMEGYMDVISLHQSGFDNAVASLGTAFTSEQARLVKRYAPRAVLCYDNDEAGKKATLRAGDILYDAGVKVRVLTVTDGKDPDEFIKAKGAEMFSVLIEDAKPLIEYKIDEARSRISSDDMDDRSEFLEEVMGILAEIKNEAQRELYLVKFADELKINPDSLRSGISGIIAKREYKDAQRQQNLKRSALGNRFSAPKDRGGTNRSNTEKLLLSLMTDKKTVKAVLDAGLGADDFCSAPIHNKLASCIFELFSAEKDVTQAEILSALEGENSGQAAAVLINDRETKNKAVEAEKLIGRMTMFKLSGQAINADKTTDDEELNRIFHKMTEKKENEKR